MTIHNHNNIYKATMQDIINQFIYIDICISFIDQKNSYEGVCYKCYNHL